MLPRTRAEQYYKSYLMRITSLQNPRIRQISRLRAASRQRRKDGLTLVEGWDEIGLALAAGHKPVLVVSAPTFVRKHLAVPGSEVVEVSDSVFKKLSNRENPDGWLAVIPEPRRPLDELQLGTPPLLVVVEAVEKPGNLGAIFRTCEAAGVDALVASDPRTDLFSPNIVRASRGTVFAVPAVTASNDEAIAFLRRRGIRILAASPTASLDYTAQDLRVPLAVALGTEDLGLSDVWLREADLKVRIPMRGKINSLNVSVAAALFIYEALRQRSAS